MCLSINSYAWNLASGTYYFDNSQTQWTNVYLFIGHSTYVRSYQLTAGSNDIYSVSMSSWDGATAVYFANGDGGVSGGSSTVNINTAPNGLPTQNITARTSNYTSQPTAGYYCIPWANSGTSIGSEWRQNLECPSGVLSGSNVMFYINQSYGGPLGVTNNSSSTCIATTDPKGTLDYYNAYLTMANGNVPSTLSVTNNCGNWVGTGGFTSQTPANAAGAYYKTGSTNQKTDATSLSVGASSTTISYGTSSITLTATTGGTTSSYGRNMYVQYYIDNGTTASATSSRITSTSTQTTLTTSSLSVGTHTIKPVLTDRLVSVLGSTITLTVETATPTTPSSNLSFSSVKPSKMTLSWTSGNGANRIVVAKAGSAPTSAPSDGSSYTANAAYGTSGTALGDGYVVYNGSSNTVTVTALTASTTYYFAIYEYNGTGTATKYLTSSYLSGNQATAAPYQITVKFKMPTENWTIANGVYLYAWNGGTLNPSGLGTWPGVAMESIGNNWYTKTFTFTNETVDIIFNEGSSSHQTTDITGVSSSTCYEPDTWTGGKWTTKIASCPGEYYYRSKGNGSWTATNSWEQSPDGINNWTDATVIPTSGTLGITIQSGHTITVSSAVNSPNCTVNGTLEVQNGGSLSHAPTYASGSILKYNPGVGTSIVPGAEWKPNVTSGSGYPYHIQIASGILQMSVASFANKYYAAGDVTVASGATLDFNMAYDSNVAEHQGKPVVIINGNITNNGTIYFANSTGGGNLAFQCKTMTNAGTLSLSENTSAPLQAIGGDMILTGDFINNGTFNCNGRAILFTGSGNQKIDGTTGGPYAFDFMVLDKTGGQVTLYKDVTCKGYSVNGGGYWALSLSGGTLVLNGKNLVISAEDADLATNKGRAGVQCVNGGKIKGDKDATITLLGNYTQWTASSGQSLIFDQSQNGASNVLKDLTVNRIDSAGLSDKITINNIIIDHLLDIKAGNVIVNNNLTIDTAAVGRLSSTYTTASLKVKKLILGKSPLHAAEFYRNGRTLTIDEKVMVKVHFYRTAQWNFFAFPFDISQILKADTTTTAVWNTDYSVGVYDAVRRANRTSGWKTLTNATTLKSDTGYIVNKKGTLEDLFFVPNAKSDHKSFSNPSSISPVYTAVSYTTVPGGLVCNFGWNFIAQPLVAKATSSISTGQFAYSYDPTKDAYKLYYGSDNPGYTYGGSASLVPYEAFFVKTAAAGNMGSYITSPQGVRRKTDAQPEDVVQLNLSANGNNYETLVRILPQATANYDELYDAPYSDPMNLATPRIYTLSSGSSYALALNTVPEETTVPVYVKVTQTGDYSFNWNTQLTNLPVTLTDQQTGETVDLTTETEYGFQTSTTEIKNRFYLNVPKRVITDNVNIENTDHFLRIYPQKGNIVIDGLKGSSQIYVSDMAGRVLQAKTTVDSHCTLAVPTAGLYIIVIRDEQHPNYRTKMLVW